MKADGRCDKCGAYVATGREADTPEGFFHTTCVPDVPLPKLPVQPDRLRELVSSARLVAYPDGHISPEDAARFKAAVDAFDDIEV